MYRIILFSLLLFLAKNTFAQDTLSSKIVEDRSCQLYLSKNWKELNSFGKKALGHGFDYFYLRMRMGIANYEMKNYRIAQKHFWKACQFNSSDDVVMEYLYYCYIFNAQYDEARKLSRKFSPALAKKLKTNSSPAIEYVLAEGGIKEPSLADLSDAYYGQFGIGHRVGKNISFFHAVTLFDQKSKRSDLDQKQYYISASIPVGKSWLISPSFHYLNRTITYNPPPKQQPPPGQHPPMPPQPTPPPPSTASYFVGSFTIIKSISKFDIGVGATISNIDSITQSQGNISLSYFPFGNNKVFFSTIIYAQKENIMSGFKYAFSPSITVMPFSKFIITTSYLYNQAYHISEMNGYLANNSDDLTTSRISFMGTILLSSHVNFYVLYQLENKSQINSKDNSTINYSYNNFIGGLKFIL